MACQKAKESQQAQQTRNQQAATLTYDQLQNRFQSSTQPFIVVNFFSSTCKSSEQEIPSLIELQQSETPQAEILFVALDSTDATKKQLYERLADYQLTKDIFLWGDNTQKIKQLYPDWDNSLPITLLFNQKGELLEHLKITNKNELEVLMQTHLIE